MTENEKSLKDCLILNLETMKIEIKQGVTPSETVSFLFQLFAEELRPINDELQISRLSSSKLAEYLVTIREYTKKIESDLVSTLKAAAGIEDEPTTEDQEESQTSDSSE